MATFNWPSISVSAASGPTQYVHDGVDTEVLLDTATAANSKPLPVILLDTDGTRFGVATADRQDSTNNKLDTISGHTNSINGNISTITGDISTLNISFGDANVVPATDDTGSFQLMAFVKRGMENWTSLLAKLPALVSGRIPVDGSGVTQPVSGTFWQATQPVSAASLPLPTGAATEATLSALNTKVTAVDTGAVVVSSSALPTGAATSANQTTIIGHLDGVETSLSSIDTKLSGSLATTVAGKTAVNKVRNDYSSVNVTTGAYTELLSAAQFTTACTEIEIFDSSGSTLVLATGAAASEADQIYIIPGGNGRIPLAIAGSTRISVKAVSANATSGELTINFYG